MSSRRVRVAAARRRVRERDRLLLEAFRRYAHDRDDPSVPNLLQCLAQEDPHSTALRLFKLANHLIDDLAEATGSTRDELLARLVT